LASVAAPQPAPSAAAKLAGLRVLIVDDNKDAADALGHLLSHHGSDVRISYLAEPAIDQLGQFNPAIVLLDIGLPFMDGYEACKRMRAMKGAGVRIVALTGWGQDNDRRRAADAGFDAHLTKPVEFEKLAAAAFPAG
jgi:DNA-binding response OmpR family regulator